MLLRKADWHDHAGIKYLLEQGADPNRMSRWGRTALHQAIQRDNALGNIEAMLDHGADPKVATNDRDFIQATTSGKTAIALAARRGRGDVLDLFAQRGIPIELEGVERLIAACARNDIVTIRSLTRSEPNLVSEILAEGGNLLAVFAGIGNTEGVRDLLDLGVDASAPYEEGDGYFGVPKGSLAIHVAAWRARHATVRLLIDRGSPIDVPDANGRTPMALAVRACVDSHWDDRRSPESVEALLQGGASANAVGFPSGYAEVDALLASHRE